MKLCIDCKFYQGSINVDADKCLHPSAEILNENNGVREELPLKNLSCSIMRDVFGRCQGGALFQMMKYEGAK